MANRRDPLDVLMAAMAILACGAILAWTVSMVVVTIMMIKELP